MITNLQSLSPFQKPMELMKSSSLSPVDPFSFFFFLNSRPRTEPQVFKSISEPASESSHSCCPQAEKLWSVVGVRRQSWTQNCEDWLSNHSCPTTEQWDTTTNPMLLMFTEHILCARRWANDSTCIIFLGPQHSFFFLEVRKWSQERVKLLCQNSPNCSASWSLGSGGGWLTETAHLKEWMKEWIWLSSRNVFKDLPCARHSVWHFWVNKDQYDLDYVWKIFPD